MIRGSRKLLLGLAYLSIAPLLTWQTGSLEGLPATMACLAAGVGTVVWGNVKAHEAKNGKGTNP